jgi:gamma-glutamyltranspeptidase/glutathione hydrolase
MGISKSLIAASVMALAVALVPQAVPAQLAPAAPEPPSGLEVKALATAKKFMVAAANPLAVDAGVEILKAGGSAVDAAIAVQLVLNLVEPQSSGIGGGAFLVHFDARTGRIRTWDGRETAPAAAKPDRLMRPDGGQRGFNEAVFGGQSVGTPGVVALLVETHRRLGKLPWARLFQPAIRIADDGFEVSRRLNMLLTTLGPQNFDATARAYFFDEAGAPRPVGHLLKSPAFAQTLRAIAANGADGFYKGPVAEAVVKAVREAPNHQGDITLQDLAAYRVVEREPVCVSYRRHRICGMGAPSSGMLTMGQTLKLVEPFDLGRNALDDRGMHLIAEAQKLAYADRDRYIADPAFVRVPGGLLDGAYLDARRATIDPAQMRQPVADPGFPPGAGALRAGIDATMESFGTSHLSIVDARGDAVAMTTTIENAFGARLMAAGFLLNNELTDFSFRDRDANGNPIANAVAGGKRPRSSMAPTIVLGPDNKLRAVMGSPGGSRIILYVTKLTVGLIDWKLDAQAAADLPNFGSRNTGDFEIEAALSGALPVAKLRARGHRVTAPDMTSGVHLIVRRPDGTLEGGADPRREGVARGE